MIVTVIHLGFGVRGGVIPVYVFHGGRTPNCTCRYTIISGGGLEVLPREIFNFDHPEITSGSFLDKKLSSYQFIV